MVFFSFWDGPLVGSTRLDRSRSEDDSRKSPRHWCTRWGGEVDGRANHTAAIDFAAFRDKGAPVDVSRWIFLRWIFFVNKAVCRCQSALLIHEDVCAVACWVS
jgi:hypothetical protein